MDGTYFTTANKQYRMGIIMAVQTISEKSEAIDFVHIPEDIPTELLENDTLLVFEKDLNKLENRQLLMGRTVLGMNRELQTQIFEIDRLENALSCMHEFLVQQQCKIEQLETEVNEIKTAGLIKETGRLLSRIKERIFSK